MISRRIEAQIRLYRSLREISFMDGKTRKFSIRVLKSELDPSPNKASLISGWAGCETIAQCAMVSPWQK